MAPIGATALGLARGGHGEPLLHPLVRFLLRHGRNSLISMAVTPDFQWKIPHPPVSGARSIDEPR